MDVEVRRKAGGALLIAAGELDVSTAPELNDVAVREVGTDRCDALQLDLCELSFIDSSGVNTLLEIREHCRRRGVALQITRMSARVEEVLRLTAVAPLFDIAGA